MTVWIVARDNTELVNILILFEPAVNTLDVLLITGRILDTDNIVVLGKRDNRVVRLGTSYRTIGSSSRSASAS